MYTDVYADVLFLINFSMDAISLYISARLCAAKVKAARIAVASVIGGVYSVLSIFLSLHAFCETAVFVLECVVMSCIALSPESLFAALKYSAVMFISSSLLGGIMSAAYSAANEIFLKELESGTQKGISPLVFSILACFSMAAALFLTRLHGTGNLPERAQVCITVFDKKAQVEGIFDSGNMLRDPLSGKSVIIVPPDVFGCVLSRSFIDGAKRADLHTCYELPDKEKKRFRLIPATGIAESTYLYGLLPDSVEIKYQKKGKTYSLQRDAVIGLSDGKGLSGDIRCVIPQAII